MTSPGKHSQTRLSPGATVSPGATGAGPCRSFRVSWLAASRAAVVSLIVIAVLIIAFSRMGGVNAPTPSSRDAAVGANTTSDAEEWVASVARNGVGHVDTRTSSNERKDISTYVTMGPLSSRGREALSSAIQSELEEVQATLDQRLSANRTESDIGLGQYERDLKLLARLELLRARAELVRTGVYITVPLSGNTAGSVPREPEGVVSATYGPYEVEAGGLAQVMLWVTSDKREVMRDVNQSLREVLAARREEWIADFNAASEEVRRHWFERYRTLSASSKAGASQMSNADLAEWLSSRQTVMHFSLQLSEETWTVR